MIAGLERFVSELRRAGVQASPGEWMDALRAVDLVGIEDRQRFRRALRAALVKRSGQRATFDRLFDAFFATPARGAGRRAGRGAGGAGTPFRRTTGGETRAGGSAAPQREPSADPSATEAERRSAADKRSSDGREDCRRLVEAVRAGRPGRSGRLRQVVVRDGRTDDGGRHGPEAPARRELRRRMTDDDERKLAREVPRLIERIRLRTARRLRRTRAGRPHLRRLFRENVAHGGVPFVIPRRRRKLRRSRVVLLVDVSWSTSRAAALFLWMAGEFLRPGRANRVILFVDRPVEATDLVDRWLHRGGPVDRFPEPPSGVAGRLARARGGPGGGIAPAGLRFDRMLAAVPDLNLDAPSDYGRVFDTLRRSPRCPGGRDTVLLILGDGRTNRFEPQGWALDEIASRCSATLWLVPEPVAQWGTEDSALIDYLPHVDCAVEAGDLRGVARGVAELLRRVRAR